MKLLYLYCLVFFLEVFELSSKKRNINAKKNAKDKT